MPTLTTSVMDDLDMKIKRISLVPEIGSSSKIIALILRAVLDTPAGMDLLIDVPGSSKPFTIEALLEKGQNLRSLKEIRHYTSRNISTTFTNSFNALSNSMRVALLDFLIALFKYLQMPDHTVSFGTVKNMSIYRDSFHVLYLCIISESNLIQISPFMQFNIKKKQPPIPYLWNTIKSFFHLPNAEDCCKEGLRNESFSYGWEGLERDSLLLTEKGLRAITAYFINAMKK